MQHGTNVCTRILLQTASDSLPFHWDGSVTLQKPPSLQTFGSCVVQTIAPVCERRSHVLAEPLMDELVTGLSTQMGPQEEDVSPTQQLIPERRGWWGRARIKMWLLLTDSKVDRGQLYITCPTRSDSPTSSSLSALLTRQLETLRPLCLFSLVWQTLSPWHLFLSFLTFSLFHTILHRLIHSPQTYAHYPRCGLFS